jgi:hypothetical protein
LDFGCNDETSPKNTRVMRKRKNCFSGKIFREIFIDIIYQIIWQFEEGRSRRNGTIQGNIDENQKWLPQTKECL